MRIIAVIPARLESTRLPRKLLLDQTGKPLIRHTVEAVNACKRIDRVYIATDSSEVAKAAGKYVHILETGPARNGTERIASVLDQVDADLVVNVQGDEPEITTLHLSELIDAAIAFPTCDMATLATNALDADQESPDAVKVERSAGGFATKFSRKPLPKGLRHIGVYAYSPAFLRWFVAQRPTANEEAEKLEQLRAFDKGCRIRVATVQHAERGIDTSDDYLAFRIRMEKKNAA